MWRRIPHPDTLVMGGPEIDFGILTNDTVVLREAKWRSEMGTGQGKERGKNQIQLRTEFLEKFGIKIFSRVKKFIILIISLIPRKVGLFALPKGIQVLETTWDHVCAISSPPLSQEIQRYLNWKKQHSSILSEPISNFHQ